MKQQTFLLKVCNQIHACKNVFVTDGACMASASCVNPSLTYMALTGLGGGFCGGRVEEGEFVG
jgi:GMC oxidoreductase